MKIQIPSALRLLRFSLKTESAAVLHKPLEWGNRFEAALCEFRSKCGQDARDTDICLIRSHHRSIEVMRMHRNHRDVLAKIPSPLPATGLVNYLISICDFPFRAAPTKDCNCRCRCCALATSCNSPRCRCY